MELVEAFVQFTADTQKFDEALKRVKSNVEALKPAFDKVQALAKGVFFGLVGLGTFAAKAFGDAEEANDALTAALRSQAEQADETKKSVNDYVSTLGKLQGRTISAQVKQVINPANAAKPANAPGQMASVKNLPQITSELDKFAKAMQQLTVYSKDSVKSVMTLAANLGVAAGDLEQVTRTGIGLAQKYFGGDLKEGVEAAAKAYNGNTRQLDRLIPGLKLAGSAQDKWNRIQKEGASGFSQAEERSNSFYGAMKQLWNQIGETAEQFGAVFVPYLKQGVQFLGAVAQRLQQLTPIQTQQIVKWAAMAAGVAGFIAFGPKILSFASVVTGALVNMVKAIATSLMFLVTSPIGLVVAGIAAVVVAFGYAIGSGDTFASRTIDGLMKIVGFLDHMLGSWQGFVQGLETIWNQVPHFLLEAWYNIRDSVEATWAIMSNGFDTMIYSWGSAIASFAQKGWAALKSFAENVRNMWNSMIDAIANKMAGLFVRRQARKDVEAAGAESGNKLNDKQINSLAGDASGNFQEFQAKQKEYKAKYGGRELTADDVRNIEADVIAQRMKMEQDVIDKTTAARDREHNERLAAIEAEKNAAIAGVQKWSDEGKKASDQKLNKDLGDIGQRNMDDLNAQDAARKKQLDEDLAKLAAMPKLSDKVKEAYEKIKQGLGLDAVGKFVDGIKDEAAKLQGEADKAKEDAANQFGKGKNAGLGKFGQEADEHGKNGKTIEQAFKENLTRKLVGAGLINQEEQRKKREQELEKKKEDANKKALIDLGKKQVDNLKQNTDQMKKLNDTIANGIIPVLA